MTTRIINFILVLHWIGNSVRTYAMDYLQSLYAICLQLSDGNARISRCSVALDGDMKNHCGKGALEKIAVEFTHISKCRASKSNK